jgi:hypothetical protein
MGRDFGSGTASQGAARYSDFSILGYIVISGQNVLMILQAEFGFGNFDAG